MCKGQDPLQQISGLWGSAGHMGATPPFPITSVLSLDQKSTVVCETFVGSSHNHTHQQEKRLVWYRYTGTENMRCWALTGLLVHGMLCRPQPPASPNTLLCAQRNATDDVCRQMPRCPGRTTACGCTAPPPPPALSTQLYAPSGV